MLMRLRISTNLLFFFAVLASTSMLRAQEPLVSFTFDTDLDGWTSVGVSTPEAVWEWENEPVTRGLISGGLTIESESGGGGVKFDSDFLDNAGIEGNFGMGDAPAPHRGELISPSLDFSANSVVKMSYIQSYGYFQGPGEAPFDPASRIEVSNDGGATWTVFFVNEDICTNSITDEGVTEVIDISSVAAGEADVQVKFVFDGNYYYWMLDDVKFYEEVGVDISILGFTRAKQFITPQVIAEKDSIDLEVLFTNKGTQDSDSLQFLAFIFSPQDANGDREIIFRDTGIFEGLAVGDTIIWDYDVNFSTDGLDVGQYFVFYDISEVGDTLGEVVNQDDNVEARSFNISENVLEFTSGGSGTGFSGSAISGLPEDFIFANIFNIGEGASSSLIIDSITFECFMPSSVDESLSPRSVLAFVIQFPDSVMVTGDILNGASDLNIDPAQTIDEMIAEGYAIGVGNRAFTPEDGTGGEFTLGVVDFFEGEGEVTLEPGFTYMLAVSYEGISNVIVQEVNCTHRLWHLSSIAYYPSLGNWIGLGEDQTPAIGARVRLGEMTTSVDELLPTESVQVFPNPTTDYLQLSVSLEERSDAMLYIADANGRLLSMRQFDQIDQLQERIDVQALPAGSYVLRLETSNGAATRSFIVSE